MNHQYNLAATHASASPLQNAMELHELVQSLHTAVVLADKRIRENLRTKQSATELTDMTYVIRKAHEAADDARKKLNQLHNLAQNVASLAWCGVGTGDVIVGEIAKGTGKYADAIRLPKRTPEGAKPGDDGLTREVTKEYRELFDWCAANADTALALDAWRPHWPGMVNVYNELQSLGAPPSKMPPHVSPTDCVGKYEYPTREARRGAFDTFILKWREIQREKQNEHRS